MFQTKENIELQLMMMHWRIITLKCNRIPWDTLFTGTSTAPTLLARPTTMTQITIDGGLQACDVTVSLWRNAELCDVTFEVAGVRLQAHRVIAARSEYLRLRFLSGLRDSSDVIVLDELSSMKRSDPLFNRHVKELTSNFDEFRHTPLQGGKRVGLSKETDFLGYTYKRKKQGD